MINEWRLVKQKYRHAGVCQHPVKKCPRSGLINILMSESSSKQVNSFAISISNNLPATRFIQPVLSSIWLTRS